MFKFAVVVCSAALVAAEADPLLLGAGYSGIGYSGLGLGAGIAAPLAATTYAAPIAVGKSAPCVNAANIPVPCNAGYVAPAIAAPAIAAPAIATPAIAAPAIAAPAIAAPAIAAPAIAAPAIAAPAVVSGYSGIAAPGLIGGYSGLASGIWKREADAEPEAEADPLLYGAGYAGLGLAGAAIAAPLAATTYAAPIAVGKSAPCVNAANIPVPCNAGYVAPAIAAPAIAAPAIAAPAVVSGYSGIAAPGLLGGYSGLASGIWKREADAEPQYFGAGYGHAGLGYAGVYGYGKSAPCVNAFNLPVPCRGFY